MNAAKREALAEAPQRESRPDSDVADIRAQAQVQPARLQQRQSSRSWKLREVPARLRRLPLGYLSVSPMVVSRR